ncbi:MAG: hypothetical protein BM557_04225 [Flavobacterium sp. MedPE-SWcel]|uniref:hypothetical protein n=1 Tax=uncultured Flavobacterium sp. TaxID=165435 RepID=UPI0009221E23|nr:hypothetical protein [uncultured Flavobacterium sp.]OIQ21464.1 MAG: hypothetical protein BM557_04225 [Flavobacterium sp. MedPE-SWcel]
MKKLRFILPVTVLFALQSCQSVECNNTNAIFDNNQPNEQVYKDELAKQVIPQQEDFVYTVEGYEEKDEKRYLNVAIQGDSICAIASLLVKDTNTTIEHLLQVKAKGYHNTELEGLKFTVEKDGNNTELVYNSIDHLVD